MEVCKVKITKCDLKDEVLGMAKKQVWKSSTTLVWSPFCTLPLDMKSCLHGVQPKEGLAFVLNYSDKNASFLPVTQGSVVQRGARCSFSFLLREGNMGPKRLKLALGLVSLHHTPLITAMTRPLSQRMPPSSFSTCSETTQDLTCRWCKRKEQLAGLSMFFRVALHQHTGS